MPDKPCKTIGLIINDLRDDYQAQILNGIEEYTKIHNHDLVIFVGRSIHSNLRYVIHYDFLLYFLTLNNLDGLILFTGAMNDGRYPLEALKKYCKNLNHLPLITIGQIIGDIPCILTDNKRGMDELLNHIEIWKKRSVFIKGPKKNNEAEERYEVYKTILEKHNRKPVAPPFTCRSFDRKEGERAVEYYSKQEIEGKKPKVILDEIEVFVCVDDEIAVGVTTALKKKKKKVGKEVIVTGFDWAGSACYLLPPITTVRQPLYEMGEKAVEMLMKIVNNEMIKIPITPLNTELFKIHSCRPDSSHKQETGECLDLNLTITETQREALTKKIIEQQIFAHKQALVTPWCKQILSTLISGDNNGDSFCTTLKDIFIENADSTYSGMYIYLTLKNLLSELRRILQDKKYTANKDVLNTFLDNAHHMLNQMITRKKAYEITELQHDLHIIQRINSELVTNFYIENLHEIIYDEVYELGIRYLYIVKFKPHRSFNRADTPTHIIGYYRDNNENFKVNEKMNINPFYIKDLLPKIAEMRVKEIHRNFPDTIKAIIDKRMKSIDKTDERFKDKNEEDIRSILKEDHVSEKVAEILEQQTSYTVMPLYHEYELLGYVIIDYIRSDNMIYEAIRTQLSNSIKVIKKFKKCRDEKLHLKSIVKQTETRMESMLSSIGTIIENLMTYYHKITGTHVKNVTGYAVALAEKAGYPPAFVNKIKLYAPWHDIGKIYVDTSLLNKKGTPTDDEYEKIKKHVNIGYDIINTNEIDEVAKNIARYHHEYWDGTGYPSGLKGYDIPDEARIVAIADAYDAIIADRGYNVPRSYHIAREKIFKSAGTQFDPELARIFIEEVIEKG